MTIESGVVKALEEGVDDVRVIGDRCNLSVGQVRAAIDRLRTKGHEIRNQGLYSFRLTARLQPGAPYSRVWGLAATVRCDR